MKFDPSNPGQGFTTKKKGGAAMSDKSVCEQYQEWAAEAVEDWDGQDNNDLWDLLSARLGTESPGAENARLRAENEQLKLERDAYLFMLTPKSAGDLWYAATGRADPFVVSWTAMELDGPWHDRADAIVAVHKAAGLDAAPTEGGTR